MSFEQQIKVHKMAEKFWLLVAILTSLVTIYWWATEGIEAHKFAPVVPAIAIVWYFVRRGMRKRIERQQNS
jgi:Flp pilus assembly protein TadB